jgi:hypothetical protein
MRLPIAGANTQAADIWMSWRRVIIDVFPAARDERRPYQRGDAKAQPQSWGR